MVIWLIPPSDSHFSSRPIFPFILFCNQIFIWIPIGRLTRRYLSNVFPCLPGSVHCSLKRAAIWTRRRMWVGLTCQPPLSPVLYVPACSPYHSFLLLFIYLMSNLGNVVICPFRIRDNIAVGRRSQRPNIKCSVLTLFDVQQFFTAGSSAKHSLRAIRFKKKQFELVMEWYFIPLQKTKKWSFSCSWFLSVRAFLSLLTVGSLLIK